MKKISINKKYIWILAAIYALCSYSTMFAQTVPANLQAALFKKIFSFNKTLQSKGVEVTVIGGAADIVSAFKEVGLNVKVASGNTIPDGTTVLYVGSGAASTKSQTSAKGILSISGDVSLVESGKVTIALGTNEGKPKIIINRTQLKAEGQELSAEILKIAELIQ